ncbi:MAG TPA: transglycosylase domain-containing protein [Pseudorhodoplanes sp.]|jgi:penicillin-binding protein 1A|nr:transglycosylase domain-containing protein [Pseudorhodoplanes sp.]
MALRRRKAQRREPTFGLPRINLDLRLSARDRAAPEEAAPVSASSGRAGEKAAARAQRRKGRGPSWKRLVYWTAVLGLWAFIAGLGAVVWVGAHLPPIQSLEVPPRPPSIQIAGLDGTVLVTRGDSGVSVALKDLPPHVPNAFLAIEDRRFYEHHGVDPIGIARALVMNVLRRGVSQGGSTLTQQLAKNLFLTQERTLGRKIQEVALALWLERKFSKTEILELYLNRVYFGAGAYGIEAASERYFGKSARQLTVAEAAMLAGIVKSPSRLAPTRNPEGATRRAEIVINAMKDTGLLDAQRARIALSQPARALKQVTTGAVNYLADWIMDALDDLVGRVEEDIVVQTSIDPALQAAAETIMLDELTKKGDRFSVGQGALVAMSPDGAVRAMIGGRDYAASQFNRAVSAKRQPGSAFKPFVYLTAIERGLTPDTIREDKPISVKGWRPENYTHEYFGPVTLTQALAMSLNTVSVRLTLEFGPTAVARTAYRLGISSKLEPNASLALGTSEVSLLELVSAYAPFANSGMAAQPHVVDEIYTKQGKLLYRREAPAPSVVIEPRYVQMMNAMMQETLLMGTARKAELPGWQAAGKTGTSQDFRDAWFIGYTRHLVAGIWLGNDDNSPMKKATGGGLPVEIWSRFMKAAHRGVPVAALPPEPGGFFSGFSGGRAVSSIAPTQVSAQSNGGRQQSIDQWLADKLFGRR